MDESKIEPLLRKAPAPKAPPGLLDTLQADVRISRSSVATEWQPGAPWWRQWLPAAVCATLAIAGVAVIAAQSIEAAKLRQENAVLRAAAVDVEKVRLENVALAKLRAQQDELESLRKAHLDLERLRQEVPRLREQAQAMAASQANNKQPAVQASTAPLQKIAGDQEIDDAIADAKVRSAAIRCVNNLKQIGLGGKVYAGDHDDVFPSSFLAMTEELNTPKVLICPGDDTKDISKITDWTNFSPSLVSYELVTPGLKDDANPNIIFARCPIHGGVLLYSGAVMQLGTNGLRRCPPGSTIDFYLKRQSP